MERKISRNEVKNIIAEYNYMIQCSDYKTDWRLTFDDGDIKIISLVNNFNYNLLPFGNFYKNEIERLEKEKSTLLQNIGQIDNTQKLAKLENDLGQLKKLLKGKGDLNLSRKHNAEESEFNEVASFAVIPTRKYKKEKVDCVEMEIVKKYNGEYFIERLEDIPVNIFLDKADNVVWLEGNGIEIADRYKLKVYLRNSLKFQNEICKNIVGETDIWSIIKTEDKITLRIKLDDEFYDSKPQFALFVKSNITASLEKNDGNISNILDFLTEISDNEIKNNLVIIISYMLMCQCNLPLAYFSRSPKKRLNIIIGEDKDNLLFHMLQELSACVNTSCSTGEHQDNIIMLSDTQEQIENKIHNKYDYILFIDNRNGNRTGVQEKLPTKDIENCKIQCMPTIISKEKIDDVKYFNIDLTECMCAEKVLSNLKLSKETLQHDIKSFYKYFTMNFYNEDEDSDLKFENYLNNNDTPEEYGGNDIENIFDNIDTIFDEYRDMIKEYDSDTIKFCAYLQFFFVMYIKYNTNIYINSKEEKNMNFEEFSKQQDLLHEKYEFWKSYSNEVGRNMIKIAGRMK